MGSLGGPTTDAESEWKMDYSGYFRAPMRIGIGKRDKTVGDQSSTTLHSPLVPDDQYLAWQHTRHAQRDWAEMFFSYGNSYAKGTVTVQGFNYTDTSYVIPGTQFGITQGWIELTPYMPWENVRITLKAGSFWGRYGQAGRWDAGEYDTFVFGRTHSMGETLRLEYDFADQPLTLGFEHGIGTKRPDSSVYNAARFTMLHHAHVDMLWDRRIQLGLHFLHTWTQEEARLMGYQPQWVVADNQKILYQGMDQPDGKMSIFGAEARFDMPDVFGYLYLGGSYIALKDAVTVAPAVEVMHSFGGGEYNMGVTGNYLDSEYCRWNLGIPGSCSDGNGGVFNILGQAEASVADLLGATPFGEGQDLRMKFYGMWNKINSDDKFQDGTVKLKVGTDFFFDAFPVLAFATRFDYLSPNSRIPKQSFMILSPRVVFRSAFVTHEQISLQYSRYIYKQRECKVGTPADVQAPRTAPPTPAVGGTPFPIVPGLSPDWTFGASPDERLCVQPPPSAVTPDGWGANAENQEARVRGMPYTGSHLRPDVNVITLEASMWW